MDIRKLTPPPSPPSFPTCFLFLRSALWGLAGLLALVLTLRIGAGFLLTYDLTCITTPGEKVSQDVPDLETPLLHPFCPLQSKPSAGLVSHFRTCFSHWSEASTRIRLKGVTEPLLQGGAEIWATEPWQVDEDPASQCIPGPSLHSSVEQGGAG